MTQVGVTGATGRMGQAVIETAADRDDVTVSFAVNRDPDADTIEDVPVEDSEKFASLLEHNDPDAVIDFTGPDSALRYAEDCADAGVPLVTGTTGFTDDELADLRGASDQIPLLKAANFARGVQALVETIREAAAALPGYDVELMETHHNQKEDAPSGTAKTLLSTLAEERDFDEQYGREGMQPREEGEVGVHVRRAGDIRGEHELIFAGNDEVLSLSHRAESRNVFAAGALDAAIWLAERDAGYYDFADVIGK
jgi:4-hydroxy-tetrahydrodipicolinate reductase